MYYYDKHITNQRWLISIFSNFICSLKSINYWHREKKRKRRKKERTNKRNKRSIQNNWCNINFTFPCNCLSLHASTTSLCLQLPWSPFQTFVPRKHSIIKTNENSKNQTHFTHQLFIFMYFQTRFVNKSNTIPILNSFSTFLDIRTFFNQGWLV